MPQQWGVPTRPFYPHIQAYRSSHLHIYSAKSKISKSFLKSGALLLTSLYFTLFHFITLWVVRFSPNLDSGLDKNFSRLIPEVDSKFALV